MPKKLFISLLIGFALSALTLFLAFRNVPVTELVNYLTGINFWWLVPSVAMVIAAFILRTFRWQLLLKHVGTVRFSQAFHPLMIGFMINCILPGRVGEITRPALLKKNQGVPMTAGLATVAAERIFDSVFLIILFAATFSSIVSHTGSAVPAMTGTAQLDPGVLQQSAWVMVRLCLVLLATLILLSFKTVQRWLKHQILGIVLRLSSRYPARRNRLNKFARSAIRSVDHIAAGFSLARHPQRLIACVVLTISIWSLTLLAYYVFSIGCPGVNLSLWELTIFMVVICFFIALPSVPGFWGVWEAGGVLALSLFSVPDSEAAGFTLVTHAVQMFPVILVGMLSALVTSVNVWNLAPDRNIGDAARPLT